MSDKSWNEASVSVATLVFLFFLSGDPCHSPSIHIFLFVPALQGKPASSVYFQHSFKIFEYGVFAETADISVT